MTPKYKGLALTLGDRDLVVPPLNFRAMQQLLPRIEKFTGGIDTESLDLVVDAAHAALTRNYPDLTRDDVIDMLDLDNMGQVMDAVMDVSGLRRKTQEAKAADADPLTGTGSTPT